MKPYGIPRVLDLEVVDCAVVREYGLSTRLGRLPASSKARARRRWKRLERASARALIRDCLMSAVVDR